MVFFGAICLSEGPPFVYFVHIHNDAHARTIHALSLTPCRWTTVGGSDMPTNAAMHQLRQGRRRLLAKQTWMQRRLVKCLKAACQTSRKHTVCFGELH